MNVPSSVVRIVLISHVVGSSIGITVVVGRIRSTLRLRLLTLSVAIGVGLISTSSNFLLRLRLGLILVVTREHSWEAGREEGKGGVDRPKRVNEREEGNGKFEGN